MIVKEIRDEDFTSYKKPSMVVGFPRCSWKCGKGLCQNSPLATTPDIDISINSLIERYMNNPITNAVICAGLEPFDSWEDLQCFIMSFRYWSPADIVIYTGYKEEELKEQLSWLSLYAEDGPIIVKFGRYIPNQQTHFDETLGVYLASNNQYARRITYNEDYIKPR
jgi:hypothetical protein